MKLQNDYTFITGYSQSDITTVLEDLLSKQSWN